MSDMGAFVIILLLAALIGLSLFCLRFSGSDDLDEDEQDRQIREAF